VRNVPAAGHTDAKILVVGRTPAEIVHTSDLKDRDDVLSYFIGAMHVPDLATNHFVPGGVRDHPASTGGTLLGSSQMGSRRWLGVGATACYGTVVKPCNFTGKFPNVGLMMGRYLAGETLIEAYWKSLAMPGREIFIGELLATLYK
jgi:uncharacterized protein (TIGR03790 family)